MIFISKSQSHVATHRMTNHNTLFDSGILEHLLYNFCHEFHRMHIGKRIGLPMSGKVNGDDAHAMHICEDI